MMSKIAAYVVTTVPAASGEKKGIWTRVSEFSAEGKSALLMLGGFLAVGFVIWGAFKVGGAISGIATAAIAAGLFLWVINNMDTAADLVDQEMNGDAMGSSSTTFRDEPASILTKISISTGNA